MKVLITGGAGFIGSNFVQYMVRKHPDYEIVVVDSFTYAGNHSSLVPIADRIRIVTADINNEVMMHHAMAGVDVVVHLAAESHVDRSINDPSPFLKTNILGTETLLRVAMKHNVKRFHHVSTDEVFGALPLLWGKFNEDTPYAPRSPYAASKAASDHLVRSYGETYSFEYTITNCSNNYGPYHLPEKAIPLFITNAMERKPIPLYGDGKCIRDYLYVVDHCRAIDLVVSKGEPGQTYCVGAGEERNGIQLACTILDILNAPYDLIEFVEDRPGHDRRYSIDSTKIRRELGWEPSVTFDEGINLTVQWYIKNQSWWRSIKENTRIIKW